MARRWGRKSLIAFMLVALAGSFLQPLQSQSYAEEGIMERAELPAGGQALGPGNGRGLGSDKRPDIVEELVALRSANAKHFVLEDGSLMARIGHGDLHYEDEQGKFQDIQLKLVDEAEIDLAVGRAPLSKEVAAEARSMANERAQQRRVLPEQAQAGGPADRSRLGEDSFYRVLHAPYDARLPKQFAQGYTVGKGQDRLTFVPVGASSVTGSVYSDDTIYYAGVWRDTDVELQLLPDGVKETMILHSAESPTTFTFQVTGNLSDRFEAGQLQVLPAWLEDAAGEYRDVSQTIRREGGQVYIDLEADVSGLQYPVRVDPTVRVRSGISGTDAMVRNGIYQNTNFNKSMTLEAGVNNGVSSRFFMHFDLSALPENILVNTATLGLHRYPGSVQNVVIRKVTSSWSEETITWNTMPTYSSSTNKTFTAYYGWNFADITSYVQGWVEEPETNYGLTFGVTGANSIQYFVSADSSIFDSHKRPFLDINYTIPGLQVLHVSAIADASTFSSIQNQNFGNNSLLNVGYFYDEYEDEDRDRYQNTYLKFDYSPLVQGAEIRAASLNLYGGYAGSGIYADEAYGIYMVTQSWNENTITYNNAPQALVSNDPYHYTFITGPTTTWREADITDLVKYHVHTGINHGVGLLARTYYNYYETDDYYSHFHSKEHPDTTKHPYVKIYYFPPNYPPTAPTVIAPNGGEVVDAQYTITWQAATDTVTPQAQLRYHIQLSTNGGSSWSDIVALTPAGATSYTHNFSAVPNTTNALVRVRAYDGELYGPWDPSNAVFTIQHNVAPNAPANPAPGGTSSANAQLIAGVTPTLTWTFSDPNPGDTQSAYQVVVYNTSNTIIHDTGWITSGNPSFTVPSGKLNRNTVYYWRVRVWDNHGVASNYSADRFIRTNALPVAAITSYTNGQQLNDNVLTFTWTYSDANSQPQTKYQVVGSQDNWATWGYNSGEITSASLSHTTPPLANGTWSFRIRVMDGMEWSAWAERSNLTLTHSFEPNETPATAFPIQTNAIYSTFISSSSDVDYFVYTATRTGIDQLTLQVPVDRNYDVYIYDANLEVVAAGLKSTGKAEDIIYRVTSGATYYIRIVGAGGHFSTTAPYAFRVSPYGANMQTTYQFDHNGNLISKQTVIE